MIYLINFFPTHNMDSKKPATKFYLRHMAYGNFLAVLICVFAFKLSRCIQIDGSNVDYDVTL